MKKFFIITLAALSVLSCRHPEVEQVDFDTFQPVTMNTSSVFTGDGNLNPDVQVMEDPDPGVDAKLAFTNANTIVRNILGEINCNSLIHIAGIYSGHDVDGFPITLSGKLLLPRSGPIKNLIIVSHYTIGANFEAPSETFPLEGLWATKGYAVAIADYIGYGITADHIHPYMHRESTARSVVDMALAIKPYLKHIGREPESDKVILAGYSQGGATTVAVMNMIQDEGIFPIKKVYAGGGPYDLAATYDTSIEWDETGIPCAIPMILQGINYGEDLGLKMDDFFQPRLLEGYEDWINSKKYTVKEINEKINASAIHEILTDEGRSKKNRQTARLYHALLSNSVLNFAPHAPIFLFHSTQDRTVPFVNALKAEQWFKGYDVQYDFGEYGNHGSGCVMFIIKVFQDL